MPYGESPIGVKWCTRVSKVGVKKMATELARLLQRRLLSCIGAGDVSYTGGHGYRQDQTTILEEECRCRSLEKAEGSGCRRC